MILPRKGTIKILLQGIMIRNKKIFQTEKLNELQQQQKRSLLIFPIIMAVLLIWGGPTSIAGLNGSNFVLGMTGMLLLAALAALVFGIVPFYMRYIRLQGQKKQVLENSSFITIDNIEYYREKLTGITPSAISMLEDLRLEPDKDLTACILRYEMLGVIRQTENGYEKGIETAKESENLKESDRCLIEHLVAGDWKQEAVLHAWEQKTILEIKKDGWITERFLQPREIEGNNKRQGRMALIWIIVLMLFCLCVTLGVEKKMVQDRMPPEQFEKIPRVVFVLGKMQQEVIDQLDAADEAGAGFGAQMEYLLADPAFIWKLILVFGVDSAFLLLLLFPVLYMKFGEGKQQEQSPYKRTKLGNIYTEYIYGMKNFIHDYSNLSEAEKESLVLWDDYLIYAVVLEENKKIVEEIMRRRRETGWFG